ncbi:S-layer homology domain-containing protein [Paenibacillus cremeus]|uniref:S-layer homology domain-containing protein n=1 Tax=Paenibacillus cremeus TaxID=2163881 RepID=A0A559K5R3_9BACL|nr:S-layer homology domain-containing protein [Paenibacillus cremeus]TVY07485.1 S-layer homology domain-containing protein [Paenibacillus cremeus]
MKGDSTTSFKDIKIGDWYVSAVSAAAKAGIIGGFEDATFRPNDNISREQMALMLTRAMTTAGKSFELTGPSSALLDSFADQGNISPWAKAAVTQAVGAGLMQGQTDSTFASGALASRAEAIVMLKRFLQYENFIN